MAVIQLLSVTKMYGSKVAVDDLSVSISPGMITGFLGPNGAGKSTTMRMIVGLDRPSSGNITVNGQAFVRSIAPMRTIGAVLDTKAIQQNRKARRHLEILAATHRIPATRIDEVLSLTGLAKVAQQKIKTFSLGMNQRLAIAAALLGDPSILLFDEPMNGLDPEGVAWVRSLLRHQASLGKTVLVSSHLMSEMQNTADHLIVLARGRLLAATPMADFIKAASGVASRVNSPDAARIAAAFSEPNVQVLTLEPELIEIRGVDVKQIAVRARDEGWTIYGLNRVEVSLEDAYLQLTAGAVEFISGEPTPPMQNPATVRTWHATTPAPAAPMPAPESENYPDMPSFEPPAQNPTHQPQSVFPPTTDQNRG
ncbi:MAG: ATP-binding cassette domain-containing protein [Propionibacteriaceae bacterium]|nr:ATP-binding cassette domain-containing protein [Propionibacteriaceae bacterium]